MSAFGTPEEAARAIALAGERAAAFRRDVSDLPAAALTISSATTCPAANGLATCSARSLSASCSALPFHSSDLSPVSLPLSSSAFPLISSFIRTSR